MAGAGYKLFNTGDVLTAAQVNTYLMEQTVMVFANAAARTTALSGVVSEGMISYLKDTNAVEVYDGSNWVSSDDPNAIQNTIVDAKGDLIAASAADTPARLAIGNNGETLVADSSTSTGLRWTEPKTSNPFLNSSFQIWQRGTSVASTSNAYTADRFQGTGTNNYTVSRQTTSDTTNLPFIQYCARVQRNNASTDTSTYYWGQTIETLNSIPFVGKTVTFSFYARRGSGFTGASNEIGVQFITGTGTDQNAVTGTFTNFSAVVNTGAALTTTWQRFTYTTTLATSVTQLGFRVYMTGVGTAGANDFFEFTGVQLDIGSVALPFRTNGATLAGELAACQRYYWRSANVGGSTYDCIANNGSGGTSNRVWYVINNPVTMRTAPSSMDYSTTYSDYNNSDISAGDYPVTGLGIDAAVCSPTFTAFWADSASGITQFRPYVLRSKATGTPNAFIGFSAEL